MVFSFPKGVGTAFLAAVRAEVYLQQVVVRPVGFKVGVESNVLNTPECVLEDMTTFIANVCREAYYFRGEGDVFKASCTFSGELMLSELLRGSGVEVKRDVPVLHSISDVSVDVVFRASSGMFLCAENDAFVKGKGLTGFTSVNSRHCTVEGFTVKKVGETDDCEKFEVSVKAGGGVSGEAIVRDALSAVSKNASRLLDYLG